MWINVLSGYRVIDVDLNSATEGSSEKMQQSISIVEFSFLFCIAIAVYNRYRFVCVDRVPFDGFSLLFCVCVYYPYDEGLLARARFRLRIIKLLNVTENQTQKIPFGTWLCECKHVCVCCVCFLSWTERMNVELEYWYTSSVCALPNKWCKKIGCVATRSQALVVFQKNLNPPLYCCLHSAGFSLVPPLRPPILRAGTGASSSSSSSSSESSSSSSSSS